MHDVLEVRPEGDRWVVVGGGGEVVASHRGKQHAIEAAKALAARSHGDVRWLDGRGLPQGTASYRLFTWLPRRSWWAWLSATVERARGSGNGTIAAKDR